MAAIGLPVHQPRHQKQGIGSSWQLRTVLLLVALTFHAVLLLLVKSSQIVLHDPAAAKPWNITARLMHPEPAPAAALANTPKVGAVSRTARPAAPHRAPPQSAASPAASPTLSMPGARQPEPTNQHTDQQIDGQLDVENLERQAVLIAQNRSVTFEMPQDRLIHAPNAKEQLTAAVNKAERSDCRNAYAGFGPLAIPFLVENAITGTGCKW